jgi:hypothetical protein
MIPNAKRRELAICSGIFSVPASPEARLIVGLRRDGVPEMFASMGSRMPI